MSAVICVCLCCLFTGWLLAVILGMLARYDAPLRARERCADFGRSPSMTSFGGRSTAGRRHRRYRVCANDVVSSLAIPQDIRRNETKLLRALSQTDSDEGTDRIKVCVRQCLPVNLGTRQRKGHVPKRSVGPRLCSSVLPAFRDPASASNPLLLASSNRCALFTSGSIMDPRRDGYGGHITRELGRRRASYGDYGKS
jgi:hypothetical protein